MLGYSRQYFYKQQKDGAKQLIQAKAVKDLVDRERKLLPRIGTRKLYYLIKEDMSRLGLKLGRDKLFALLGSHGLLIKPRRRYVQTTMSKHWLRKWPDIVKGLSVNQADQVWVSDITYLKTMEGNCYLNMITDAWSRKIVGYAIEDNLEAESMILALKMATQNKQNYQVNTIHHSDRGIQYCSKEYRMMTERHNIRLSMTETGDPYDNALAERMNRTIKEEFGLDRMLLSKDQAKLVVAECIALYNQKRPHLALNMKTPDQVYKTKIPETSGNRDHS